MLITRKSNLLEKITILVMCCFVLNTAIALDGSGTQEDPWRIKSLDDFNDFAGDPNYWDDYTRLETDVNLAGMVYERAVIAPDVNDSEHGFQGIAFTGVFDGNDHKILNLTVDSDGIVRSYVGLFGYVVSGEVRNLGLEGGHVRGYQNVGGLVGKNGEWSNGGKITNCYSIGDVSGDDDVGGLVGSNYDGIISNCYSTGDVNGAYTVGGLVGYNSTDGIISNCYSTGDVIGTDRAVGGLVGRNLGSLSNCYSSTNVNSVSHSIGGLVGWNEEGSISNCYSAGHVVSDGGHHVGGLVGENENGIISNCYSTGDVNGDEFIGFVGINKGAIVNCYFIGSISGREYCGGLAGSSYGFIITSYAVANVSAALEKDYGGLVGQNFGHVIASYWNVDFCSIDNGIGSPKTTAELMTASTFYNWGNDVWTINDGLDYPRLAWQAMQGSHIVSSFPWKGAGEPNSPYEIYTAEDLNNIGLYPYVWNKHFKMMSDVDLVDYSGEEFNLIALFEGVFNGDEHVISNFTWTSSTPKYNIGLFCYVQGTNAKIKNIRIINANVENTSDHSNYIGILAGHIEEACITNCYVNGVVIATDYSHVGLLAGYNSMGVITDCQANGSITGGDAVGGLLGYNKEGEITNCYMMGSITGGSYVGGLIGSNSGHLIHCGADIDLVGRGSVGGLVGGSGSAVISNCASTGEVEGGYKVGGLVGSIDEYTASRVYNTYSMCRVTQTDQNDLPYVGKIGGLIGSFDSTDGIAVINNSYAAGFVSGEDQVGGLIGYNNIARIENCFWDTQTSGQDTSDGGIPKTTSEMQDPNTFIDAGWDFTRPIWTIIGQDYPRLIWNDADIDDSLMVDLADFAFLANQWLAEDFGWCGKADLTGDQKVNIYDLSLFVNKWLHENHISDHVFWIEIEVGIDYENPDSENDTEYEFRLVVLTDGNVDHIEFISPSGYLYEIPKEEYEEEGPHGWMEVGRGYEVEEDLYDWSYELGFYNPNDLLVYDYGQYGEYRIIIHYQNNQTYQTTVKFGIPQTTDPIPQPIQIPLFTSIHNEDEVNSPIILAWEQWIQCGSVVGSWTQIDLENEDNWEKFEYNLNCENQLPEPIVLNEGLWYTDLTFEFKYNYLNDDGIKIGIGKYSESDCEFTIVP